MYNTIERRVVLMNMTSKYEYDHEYEILIEIQIRFIEFHSRRVGESFDKRLS